MNQATWERIAGFVLICIVLVVLVTTLFITPDFNTNTYAVIRFLAATAAGFCAAFFSGRFNLEAKLPITKSQVRATSAFATFLAVFILFYFNLPTEATDQYPDNSAAYLSEANVIVAQFDQRAERTVEIGRRIESALEKDLLKAELDDVNVEFTPEVIRSEIEARQVVGRNTSAVIWGWYDDYEIRVRIFLPSQDTEQEFNEIPFSLGNDSSTQISLVVRKSLPRNVSFLTFLVMGQLEYRENNYVEGYKFFDLATSGTPENVQIENEEVVPFLTARQIQNSDSLPTLQDMWDRYRDESKMAIEHQDNLTTAICGYVDAVQAKPSFSEPYNNLGVLIAKYDDDEIGLIRHVLDIEDAASCLNQLNFERVEAGLARNLLEKSIELSPNWTVPKYNLMTYNYNRSLIYGSGSKRLEEVKRELEGILKSDESLYGTHIMLSNLELELDNINNSKNHLMEALEIVQSLDSLSPLVVSNLYVNLGQLSLKMKQYQDAEADFENALRVNSENAEAILALANLAVLNDEDERALELIESISTLEIDGVEQAGSALYSAKVLESFIYLREQKYDSSVSAIKELNLERTAPGGYVVPIPLSNYMLGLLYGLQDENTLSSTYIEIAQDAYEGSDTWDHYNHSRNNTMLLVWTEVTSECFTFMFPREFAIEQDKPDPLCSLDDRKEHTLYVYDKFIEKLTDRLFYRGGLLVIGG